jgi:SAM-dependent methyltransferase
VTAVTTGLDNAAQRRRWSDPRYVERMGHWEVMNSAVTPYLLESLALVAGDRVVDVGCGLGASTRAAAAAVAPAGSAVGVDISAPMLAEAGLRAATAPGLAPIAWQVADAQTAEFAGAPFAAAMSQFGVMFFADPQAAFTNIRRQLVPGGRFGFACWPVRDRCPWSLTTVLADLLPPAEAPQRGVAPGPFSLAEPARVTRLLTDAGFSRIDVRTVTVDVDLPRDAVVDDTELRLMGVPAGLLGLARERVARHLGPFRAGSDRVHLPLTFHLCRAET